MAAVVHLLAEAPLIAWGVYAAAVGLWTIPPIVEKAGKNVASGLPASSGATPTLRPISVASEATNLSANQSSEVVTNSTAGILSRCIFQPISTLDKAYDALFEMVWSSRVPSSSEEIEQLSFIRTLLQWFYHQLLAIKAVFAYLPSPAESHMPSLDVHEQYPYYPRGLLVGTSAFLLAASIVCARRTIPHRSLRQYTTGVLTAVAAICTVSWTVTMDCAQDFSIALLVFTGVEVVHRLFPRGQIRPTIAKLRYLNTLFSHHRMAIFIYVTILFLINYYKIFYTPTLDNLDPSAGSHWPSDGIGLTVIGASLISLSNIVLHTIMDEYQKTEWIINVCWLLFDLLFTLALDWGSTAACIAAGLGVVFASAIFSETTTHWLMVVWRMLISPAIQVGFGYIFVGLQGGYGFIQTNLFAIGCLIMMAPFLIRDISVVAATPSNPYTWTQFTSDSALYPWKKRGLVVALVSASFSIYPMSVVRRNLPRLGFMLMITYLPIAIWTHNGYLSYKSVQDKCAGLFGLTVALCAPWIATVGTFENAWQNWVVSPVAAAWGYAILGFPKGYHFIRVRLLKILTLLIIVPLIGYLALLFSSNFSSSSYAHSLNLGQPLNISLRYWTAFSIPTSNETLKENPVTLFDHIPEPTTGTSATALEPILVSSIPVDVAMASLSSVLEAYKAKIILALAFLVLIFVLAIRLRILRSDQTRVFALSFILVGFGIKATWQHFTLQAKENVIKAGYALDDYIVHPMETVIKYSLGIDPAISIQIRTILGTYERQLARFILAIAFILPLSYWFYIKYFYQITSDIFGTITTEISNRSPCLATQRAFIVAIFVLIVVLVVVSWHYCCFRAHCTCRTHRTAERSEGSGPDNIPASDPDRNPTKSPKGDSDTTPELPPRQVPTPENVGTNRPGSQDQSVPRRTVSNGGDDKVKDGHTQSPPPSRGGATEAIRNGIGGVSPHSRHSISSRTSKRRSNPALATIKLVHEIETRRDLANHGELAVQPDSDNGSKRSGSIPSNSPLGTGVNSRDEINESTAHDSGSTLPSDERDRKPSNASDDSLHSLFYSDSESDHGKTEEAKETKPSIETDGDRLGKYQELLDVGKQDREETH
jgi:hypothetical protein